MKTLFVSIFGSPNVGKSTIVNSLVGFSISAVSNKVQTTRNIVRGILTEGDTQIVFIDTPGIFDAYSEKDKVINENAKKGIRQGTMRCLVIDAKKGIDQTASVFLKQYNENNEKLNIIINRMDISNKEKVLAFAETLQTEECVEEIFFTSATEGRGMAMLKDFFLKSAVIGDWAYLNNEITNLNQKALSAEITREQLYRFLRHELPYNIEVETEKIYFEDEKKELLCIEQVIFVSKISQKKIVIGAGGKLLKMMAHNSKEKLSCIFDCDIKLNIFVKVQEYKEQ